VNPFYAIIVVLMRLIREITTSSELTVLKPTDMFYSKLLPALKERGIVNIMSRREWPLDVLKRVFLQLFKETPRWILSQELWCFCSSPAEWWKKTCVYNRYAESIFLFTT